MNTTHKAWLSAACLTVGALSAGCGRVAPLEQPAPLFGDRQKAEYYARRQDQASQAAARSAAERNAQGSAERDVPTPPPGTPANRTLGNTTSSDPNADDAPLTTRDVRDPETQMTTPRDSPVPGAPNSMGPTPSVTPQAH